MGNTNTTLKYQGSEFVSASNPNPKILLVELGKLALSVQPIEAHVVGTDVVLEWSGLPTVGDVALIDAQVASHTGGFPSHAPRVAVIDAETSHDDTALLSKVKLDTGLLAQGTYILVWSVEMRTTKIEADTWSRAVVTVNGVEVSEESWHKNMYHSYSSMMPLVVSDGDTREVEILTQRIGASNPVFSRRARLYLIHLPTS